MVGRWGLPSPCGFKRSRGSNAKPRIQTTHSGGFLPGPARNPVLNLPPFWPFLGVGAFLAAPFGRQIWGPPGLRLHLHWGGCDLPADLGALPFGLQESSAGLGRGGCRPGGRGLGEPRGNSPVVFGLGPPARCPFYHFLAEGSPAKLDHTEKNKSVPLCSNLFFLEDLVGLGLPPSKNGSWPPLHWDLSREFPGTSAAVFFFRHRPQEAERVFPPSPWSAGTAYYLAAQKDAFRLRWTGRKTRGSQHEGGQT